MILALSAARAQTETEVEIEEYWGDFMVEQGKLQRIRCLGEYYPITTYRTTRGVRFKAALYYGLDGGRRNK